jgi:acyl-CoA reductase-like NAD-dependent aldehyde dehydrogenase
MTDMSVVDRSPRAFLVAGAAVQGPDSHEVRNPYDGSVVARISTPAAADVERAAAAAAEVAPTLAALPAHVRAEALAHVARRLREEREDVARIITAESGKPLRWARIEVGRATQNIATAAEEVKRRGGEVIPLDGDPIGAGRMGIVRRFPIGPVLGITPFNFPLNLVAHKVGPALAVGAPIVLKPAPQTPLTALRLGELIAETDLPAGAFSVLPVPNGPLLEQLVADPRLPVISFTGSQVGWAIRSAQPRKRVLLELGGNAVAIVHEDADLERAAGAIAAGAFIQAGQTCISTQRVLVHADVAERFNSLLADAATALAVGDPADDGTIVGPLVSVDAADRIQAWVEEAVADGADVRCGGTRDGTTFAPTVLGDARPASRIWAEEVFGPVVATRTYTDIDEAFAEANDSRFGLQAGIFTRDLGLAMRAHRELEVGTVIVGDSPSYRADPLPYGGWKESGVGREGIRFAMDDLTDSRSMVVEGV